MSDEIEAKYNGIPAGFGTKYKELLADPNTAKRAERILAKYLTIMLEAKKREHALMLDLMAAVERAYDLMREGREPRLMMLRPVAATAMSRVSGSYHTELPVEGVEGLPALVLESTCPARRQWDLELFFDSSLALEYNKKLAEAVGRAKRGWINKTERVVGV